MDIVQSNGDAVAKREKWTEERITACVLVHRMDRGQSIKCVAIHTAWTEKKVLRLCVGIHSSQYNSDQMSIIID